MPIDFEKLNATTLLELIPEHVPGQVREDDRFECKSAIFLTEAKRKHELKEELAKQVSAFSNSGGGILVFGINGKTRALEPCEDKVGNQPMSDFLDQLIEISVDQPIRSFRVHRVPFDGDTSKGIYLIDIWDSPAAPHQAKDERQYYYRSGNQSKAAPHFYLELLRHRYTKAVLEITDVQPIPQNAQFSPGMLMVDVIVTVQNKAKQAAQHWAVFAQNMTGFEGWSTPLGDLAEGVWITELGSVIMPGQKKKITVPIRAGLGEFTHTVQPLIDQLWRHVAIKLLPVSDNFVGEPHIVGNWKGDKEFYMFRAPFEQGIIDALHRNGTLR